MAARAVGVRKAPIAGPTVSAIKARVPQPTTSVTAPTTAVKAPLPTAATPPGHALRNAALAIKEVAGHARHCPAAHVVLSTVSTAAATHVAMLHAAAAARGIPAAQEARKFDTAALPPWTTMARADDAAATDAHPTLLRDTVRHAFRAHQSWTDPDDCRDLVDSAFAALRQAHARVGVLEDPDWTPRPPTIKFRVGQIVRHQKYNYRGVIVGWDTTCRQTRTWMRINRIGSLKHAEHQPFYQLLVDRNDDPRRDRTYCAEENLMDELEFWDAGGCGEGEGGSGGGKEALCCPDVDEFFDSYNPETNWYTLNEQLRQQYPED